MSNKKNNNLNTLFGIDLDEKIKFSVASEKQDVIVVDYAKLMTPMRKRL